MKSSPENRNTNPKASVVKISDGKIIEQSKFGKKLYNYPAVDSSEGTSSCRSPTLDPVASTFLDAAGLSDKDLTASISSKNSSIRPEITPSRLSATPSIQVTPVQAFKYPSTASGAVRRSPQSTLTEVAGKCPTTGLDMRDDFWSRCRVYKKKPKNIFFSQLYSIFHIACTIALLRISGNPTPNRHWFTLIVYYYHGYLLGTSILFIILIRCWITKDYYGPEEGHQENTSILFGSIALGLVQLIAIGLNLAQCLTDQFIFIPILQFLFVFLLMHFIFTRAQHGPKYSLKNIAVAHLFACQLSQWLVNFDPNYGTCGYRSIKITSRADFGMISSRLNIFPASYSDLLLPILHNYQLLSTFILGYMWIQNNRCRYNHLKPRLSELEETSSFSFAKKPSSIKGFFMGILIISTALIVLLLGDPEITLITHTSVQGLSATAALIGLILRGRKRKGLHKIADPCLDPNDNHIMSIVTVIGAYSLAFYDIILNSLEDSLTIHKIINHSVMIIQITLQTFLLRSDGRRIHRSRDIFAYLILSNFSLWILEITDMATHLSGQKAITLQHLPQLLVTLNRFYSGLVFIHFWKIK